MKKLIFLTLAFSICFGLVWISGCSDDDKSTGTNTTVAPEAVDSNFMNSLFGEDLLMNSIQSIEVSMALLDSIPNAPIKENGGQLLSLMAGDQDIIITAITSYDFVNGWHIFQFEASVVDLGSYDTTNVIGWDSVRVSYLGTPLEFPNSQSEMDEFLARAHVYWYLLPDSLHNAALHHRLDVGLNIQNNSDTLISLSGSVNDTISVQDSMNQSYCQVDLTLNQTLSNFQFYPNSPDTVCPESGTISAMVTLDVACTGGEFDTLNVNGAWTITAIINNDNSVTIRFTNGVVSWSVTEPCGGGVAAKSYWYPMRD